MAASLTDTCPLNMISLIVQHTDGQGNEEHDFIHLSCYKVLRSCHVISSELLQKQL